MPNASLSVSMFAARKQKRSLTRAHVERLLRWWFFLEISNDSKEEEEEEEQQEDKEEEEEEEEEKVSVIKMIKMKLKNK